MNGPGERAGIPFGKIILILEVSLDLTLAFPIPQF